MPNNIVPPLLVSDRQAAAMLSISRAHLHRLRAAGRFVPGLKIGKSLRFKVSDLESFVAAGCDFDRWHAMHDQRARLKVTG